VRRGDVRASARSAGAALDDTAYAKVVANIRRALESKGWTLRVDD
jgi:hypothetical protein